MEVWDPVYEHEDEWTFHAYRLAATNDVLRFQAKDIRKERTGVHASLHITLNWKILAYSEMNVDRDEDRVRISNSAYSHFDGADLIKAEMTKAIFKHSLDLFCVGLWDEEVGVDLGGDMEGDPDILPAQRLIGDWVLKDAGALLFAPPGEGKSYTSMAIAVSMAWGIDSIWPLYEAAKPLYVNVERSELSMKARLARVNVALGLDPRTPLPFLNARGKKLDDIYESAKRTLKREGCTVVFYDSISRAGFGSLVADDVANKTMDMLNALCPTWFALAHSPRADASHAFGSQMFDAAADLTIQLRSQTSADGFRTGVGLQVIKANDLRKGPMQIHAFEWEESGLKRIRRAGSGEFVELEASVKQGVEDQLVSLIGAVGALSATDAAKELGKDRGQIATILSKSGKFQKLLGKMGTKQLYGLAAEKGQEPPPEEANPQQRLEEGR